MPSQKHGLILGVTVTMMVFVGLWLEALHSNQIRLSHSRASDSVGAASEAFELASQAIEVYLPNIESDPFRIDPEFRATLSSRSKIWTIRGYAFCLNNEKKSYRWTVILNYNEMQEWEILAQIVTPEIRGPLTYQKDGISKAKGALIDGTDDH
jgi:hypothetical protein